MDNRPITLLCSNIVWDTAVIDRDICFSGLFDWVRYCINCFKNKPHEILVIRVHPAEVRLHIKTLERLQDRIEKEFPHLPENVRVVRAENSISTYHLIEIAHRVIVYTSTVGLEAALMSKEVLVCARTHYRDKGFTIDINDRDAIQKTLDRPPNPLSEEALRTCRKYAWHFFFNMMIPYPFVHEYSPGLFRFNFDDVEELFQGNNEFAKFFCLEMERRPKRFLMRRDKGV